MFRGAAIPADECAVVYSGQMLRHQVLVDLAKEALVRILRGRGRQRIAHLKAWVLGSKCVQLSLHDTTHQSVKRGSSFCHGLAAASGQCVQIWRLNRPPDTSWNSWALQLVPKHTTQSAPEGSVNGATETHNTFGAGG
eukprot:6142864-Pyramimonas_sp.AAC.1